MRLIDGNALQIEMMDRGVDHIQTDDLAEINQIIDAAPTIDAVILPKGATNGDMIKTMFSNVEIKEKNNVYEVYFGVGTAIQFFNHQWWNAPYKAESEE